MKVTLVSILLVAGYCNAVKLKDKILTNLHKDQLATMAKDQLKTKANSNFTLQNEGGYSCGGPVFGCGWYYSTTTNFGGDGTTYIPGDSGCSGRSLNKIAGAIKGKTYGTDYWNNPKTWFGIAPSEQMYEGNSACGSCLTPRSSQYAANYNTVLHLGCGDCIDILIWGEGSSEPNINVGGIVVDNCPQDDNPSHCRRGVWMRNKKWPSTNSGGAFNHVDVLHEGKDNSASANKYLRDKIGDGPRAYIKRIDCPWNIKNNIDNAAGTCTGYGSYDKGCPGAVGCGYQDADCAK